MSRLVCVWVGRFDAPPPRPMPSSHRLLPCALLASLAAPAAAQAPAQDPAVLPVITMRPGEGITFDGGDAFRLTFKNRIQTRWEATVEEDAPDEQGFRLRRVRTGFAGHVFRPEVLYLLQFQWIDTDTPVKDAWAQWNFVHEADDTVGLRTGQSDTYYGLEGTGTSSGLFFLERSDATKFFSDSRGRGAWLHGLHADRTVRWTLGATNRGVASRIDGSEEADNTDNELVWTASANIDPLGDYVGGGKSLESLVQGDLADTADLRTTLGAAFAHDGQERDVFGIGSPTTSDQATLNAMAKWRGFWLAGEGFWRSDEAEDGRSFSHHGFWAALGYTLPRADDGATQWGLGARWSTRDPDAEVQGAGTSGTKFDAIRELSFSLNAFHRGHPLKTQLGVVHTTDDTTDTESLGIVLQLQVTI